MNIVNYSPDLKNAAEEYLLRCFKDHKFGIEAHNLLIQAAMIVIQGAGWVQEQQFVVGDEEGNAIDAVSNITSMSDEEFEMLEEED